MHPPLGDVKPDNSFVRQQNQRAITWADDGHIALSKVHRHHALDIKPGAIAATEVLNEDSFGPLAQPDVTSRHGSAAVGNSDRQSARVR